MGAFHSHMVESSPPARWKLQAWKQNLDPLFRIAGSELRLWSANGYSLKQCPLALERSARLPRLVWNVYFLFRPLGLWPPDRRRSLRPWKGSSGSCVLWGGGAALALCFFSCSCSSSCCFGGGGGGGFVDVSFNVIWCVCDATERKKNGYTYIYTYIYIICKIHIDVLIWKNIVWQSTISWEPKVPPQGHPPKK